MFTLPIHYSQDAEQAIATMNGEIYIRYGLVDQSQEREMWMESVYERDHI